MARTFEQIKAGMVAKKNEYGELGLLSSTSKTAIWTLIFDVVAFSIYTLEVLFDYFKLDVQAVIDAKSVASIPWFVNKAKEFQLGDDVYIDSAYRVLYPVIDTSKRIVTASAAVEESNSSVTIKFAKGALGSYSALSAPEQAQFRGYFEKIKPAGSKINYVSLSADMLRLGVCNVYYDSIYNASVVATNFAQSVNAYLAQIGFNGKINVNDFIAYVKQNTDGVLDFTIATISSFQNATNTPIVREYVFVSGYAFYDAANSTVTYTAV